MDHWIFEGLEGGWAMKKLGKDLKSKNKFVQGQNVNNNICANEYTPIGREIKKSRLSNQPPLGLVASLGQT